MKNKEKRVIILDKLSSPFVAQAIIILKEGAECAEEGIIAEAERIVEGYFPRRKKISAKGHRLLAEVILLIVCTAISAALGRLL